MSFPFAEHWHVYALFTAFIFGCIYIDLKQTKKDISPLISSLVWIAIGLLTGVGIYAYSLYCSQSYPYEQAVLIAKQHALEYYAGYLVEKSLAVDNIFVFLVIFSQMGIPHKNQPYLLKLGVIGAIVLRAIFIALGSLLLDYEWVLWLFGALIFLSGVKLLFSNESPENSNRFISKLTHYLPVIKDTNSCQFFVFTDNRWKITPFFLALIAIELSDVVFALDSVPAIFGLTREPLIVFTSNISAIMGLRAMFFLLSDMVSRFHLLKYGLAATLLFIGTKMCFLNPLFDGHFPIGWSLAIISLCLGGSLLASYLIPKENA